MRLPLAAFVLASAGAALASGACGDDPPAVAAVPDGGVLPDGAPIPPGAEGGTSTSGDPPYTYVDFDVNHVLITGQSNSVANGGTPPLSTTQPFENVMFDTGVMSMSGCADGEGCKKLDDPKSFVPLVEGDKFFNYAVETPAAGLANEITKLRAGHVVLAGVHGRSGNTYQCLRKGGCDYKTGYVEPFEQGLLEVEAAQKIASAAGKSYVVRAVAVVHGESDHYSYTDGSQEFPLDGTDGKKGAIADYSDGLVEWQRDYETEIRARTMQAEPVPLLVSQISGWNDQVASKIAQWQLDAHVKAPGKVVLVGPSYPLPLSQEDCLHFTNEGSRRLGEYFAKVYAQLVFEGKTWEPVRPKSVSVAGAVITVTFFVPKPPLVLDTEKVAAAPNMGFSYSDDGASPAITKVEVAGADTVTITLASAPAAGKKRLRYAMNQEVGGCIGTPSGARGNVRDSDDTPSQSGYDLHNWAVHFDVPVP